MRLRKLVVNRAPVATSPGNAVGVENVAVQIALVILQRPLIRRAKMGAIVGKQRRNILVQHGFGDFFAHEVKASPRRATRSCVAGLCWLRLGTHAGETNSAKDTLSKQER